MGIRADSGKAFSAFSNIGRVYGISRRHSQNKPARKTASLAHFWPPNRGAPRLQGVF